MCSGANVLNGHAQSYKYRITNIHQIIEVKFIICKVLGHKFVQRIIDSSWEKIYHVIDYKSKIT